MITKTIEKKQRAHANDKFINYIKIKALINGKYFKRKLIQNKFVFGTCQAFSPVITDISSVKIRCSYC